MLNQQLNNKTLKDEQKLFTKLLEFRNRLDEATWVNRRETIPDSVLIQKYFQSISDDDIRGLVDLYKLDFQMFNYTFTFRNKTFI